MDIQWFGHSCFRLRTRGATVITDPCGPETGYEIPRMRADIVTVSHEHEDHNYCRIVAGDPKILRGPGEYEIKGIFIVGISTYHDRKKGQERGKNTVFTFEMDGLRICHLGDLGHVPSQEQIEELSDVSVLLIPVGGGTTINAAQAAEVVSLLEPNIVIPMHYSTKDLAMRLDPVSKFLAEMGQEGVKPQEMLQVQAGNMPEETQVVLLEYKH
ncbi:MAG: MBL fold metallo-hydrolase [Chloroflexi bacterium]|nr:MBL fold metallo-hydrolase [Chloroflexota bacterium]